VLFSNPRNQHVHFRRTARKRAGREEERELEDKNIEVWELYWDTRINAEEVDVELGNVNKENGGLGVASLQEAAEITPQPG
jgi:hypothetical protein